jgi:hypothetical protein
LRGLTAYVTPWGGLNIAGHDRDTGRPTVYWWTPGMTDWISDVIEVDSEPGDDEWPSSMASIVRGSELNLVGFATGEIVRLSWNPGDGSVWTLENLTDLAR